MVKSTITFHDFFFLPGEESSVTVTIGFSLTVFVFTLFFVAVEVLFVMSTVVLFFLAGMEGKERRGKFLYNFLETRRAANKNALNFEKACMELIRIT